MDDNIDNMENGLGKLKVLLAELEEMDREKDKLFKDISDAIHTAMDKIKEL